MSFNTTVEKTTMMGKDAATFLNELDTRREQNGGAVNGAVPNDYDAMVRQQREVEMQLEGMHVANGGGDSQGDNTSGDDDDDFMDEAG